MFNPNYFSAHLKELRRQHGVTIAEVAEAVGLQRPSVNRWETGDRQPSIDMLWRLADYFDVSLDDLVGRKR